VGIIERGDNTGRGARGSRLHAKLPHGASCSAGFTNVYDAVPCEGFGTIATKEFVIANMLGFKYAVKSVDVGALGIMALCAGFSPVASGETLIEVGITKPADLKPSRAAIQDAGDDCRGPLLSKAKKIKKNQPLHEAG